MVVSNELLSDQVLTITIGGTGSTISSVRTGDNTPIMLMIALIAAALAALAAGFAFRRHRTAR